MGFWSSIKKLFHKNERQAELPDDLVWTVPPRLESNQVEINRLNPENRGRDIDDIQYELFGRMMTTEDQETQQAPELAAGEPLEEDPQEQIEEQAEEQPELAQQDGAAVEAPVAAERSVQEKMESENSAVDRLEGYREYMGGIGKKGGGANSQSFEKVMSSLQATLDSMDSPLDSGDMYGSTKTIIRSVKSYGKVIKKCQKYLDSHKDPWTTAGKLRRKAIANLQGQAEKDLQGLRDYSDIMSSLPEDERADSIREVLTRSRRRVIQLKKREDGSDVRDSDLGHVGDKVSLLTVINSDDTTDGASGFFKEQESINMESDEAYGKHEGNLKLLGISRPQKGQEKENIATSSMFDVWFALNKQYKTSEQKSKKNTLQKLIENNIKSYNNINDLFEAKVRTSAEYKNDSEFKDIAESCYDLMIKKNGFLADKGGGVKDLNMSGRNVATSRVANMLGLGDLIAQSETAVFRESDGGGEKIGNLMQKATGSELYQKVGELSRENYNEQLVGIVNKEREIAKKEGKTDFGNVGDAVTEDDAQEGYSNMMRREKLSENAITPEYMRSMISLQVLDALVGQTDRHLGNIFVDSKGEGKDVKFGKVMGIDNDYSFGNTSLYGTDDSGNIGVHGRSFAVGGEFSLPYMDADLATRIEELDKSEVELMLADVLEDWAIDSFWKRIEQAKKVIKDAKNKDESRFINADQWDMDKYHEFVNASVGGGGSTNYLQRVHNDDQLGIAESIILKEKEKRQKAGG